MEKKGIVARLIAKPGKEQAVEDLLKSALAIANAESKTIRWYALKFSEDNFGVFDTFQDEDGRAAHINGEIPKALTTHAALFASAPVIETVDLIAVK